jgi:hypothetical protein
VIRSVVRDAPKWTTASAYTRGVTRLGLEIAANVATRVRPRAANRVDVTLPRRECWMGDQGAEGTYRQDRVARLSGLGAAFGSGWRPTRPGV